MQFNKGDKCRAIYHPEVGGRGKKINTMGAVSKMRRKKGAKAAKPMAGNTKGKKGGKKA